MSTKVDNRRARDIAAQAVDMSPATYERITRVITVIQVLELLQSAVCPGRARVELLEGVRMNPFLSPSNRLRKFRTRARVELASGPFPNPEIAWSRLG